MTAGNFRLKRENCQLRMKLDIFIKVGIFRFCCFISRSCSLSVRNCLHACLCASTRTNSAIEKKGLLLKDDIDFTVTHSVRLYL